MTTIEPGSGREWRAHWPTVLASAVGMSFSTLYLYSSGALIAPIEKEFGWSRAAIGSGIAVTTAVGAVLGPFVGAAVDRFGSRRLAVPGILLYCAVFSLVSFATPSIWMWWFLWFVVGLSAVGIKPSIWTTAVAGLFTRGRGLALAVTLCGTGIGSTFAPLVTVWMSEAYGWRYAFIGIALIWGAVGFPLIFFCFHDASSKHRGSSLAPPPKLGLSMRASLLSWRFGALALSAMLFTLVAVSLVASMIPVLSSHGISRATAAGIASVIGITSIIGRLTSGYLLDRLEPRYVTAVSMLLPLVTLGLLLAFQGSVPAAIGAALVMGHALGAEVDATAYLTGHYFGLRHYGLLFGALIGCTAISTGSGPLIAGYIYDRTGSYDLLLMVGIPTVLIATTLILLLGRAPQWHLQASPAPA